MSNPTDRSWRDCSVETQLDAQFKHLQALRENRRRVFPWHVGCYLWLIQKETAVLRISCLEKDGTTWLRLEGKLLGPWVEELRASVGRVASQRKCIKLDLMEVTFVDSEGLRLLRALIEDGHEVANRSNFVAELLRTEMLP